MRMIDAEALIDCIPKTDIDIFENCRNCTTLTRDEVLDIIMSQKNIDAVPVSHAHWEMIESDGWNIETVIKCSNCGGIKETTEVYRYCPDCGARMEGFYEAD